MVPEQDNNYSAEMEKQMKKRKHERETEMEFAELVVESASLTASFNGIAAAANIGIGQAASGGEILKNQFNAASYAIDSEKMTALKETGAGMEACEIVVDETETFVLKSEKATKKRIEEVRLKIKAINQRKKSNL